VYVEFIVVRLGLGPEIHLSVLHSHSDDPAKTPT
jgi:hypothetical protein